MFENKTLRHAKWFTEYNKMLLFVKSPFYGRFGREYQNGISCSPGPGIMSGIGPDDSGAPNEKGEGDGSLVSVEFILDPSFTGASESVSCSMLYPCSQFSNFAYFETNRNFTSPTAPERCFATIKWARRAIA